MSINILVFRIFELLKEKLIQSRLKGTFKIYDNYIINIK